MHKIWVDELSGKRGREQAAKLLLLEANVKELAKGDKLWIEVKWAEGEKCDLVNNSEINFE